MGDYCAAEYKRRRKKNLIAHGGAFCTYCKCELITDGSLSNHPRFSTLDHYIPKSKVREEIPNNKVLACLSCNRMKGSMMPEDFKKLIKFIKE